MNVARHISEVLIVVTALVWIAWDLYAVHVPGATESEVIRSAARHPLVPFLIGVLMGHFFGIQWRAPGD